MTEQTQNITTDEYMDQLERNRNLTWKNRANQTKNIHESSDDLFEELINNLNDLKRGMNLKHSLKSDYKIGYKDIADLIIYTCDVIRIYLDDPEEKDPLKATYAIYNPQNKNYIRNDEFLKRLINRIITNDDLCKLPLINTTKEVDAFISTSEDIRDANLPPSYIVKFNNQIYDIKNKQEHDGLDENGNEYDFLNCLNFNIKQLDDVNQNKLDIVKQTFNLWSKNNEDNERLIRQIAFAALEGYGRERYIILKSNGGDGKSTFQYILELFAGKNNTHRVNLHQFADDNALNNISESTKLIIGDDLQSKYKVSNVGMTNLKSLVTNETLNLNVKFMPNKLVKTHAVMIQNTNTDPNFYENTTAIKSRVLLFEWCNYDFRKNPITDYNLDQLLGRKKYVGDREFIEALLSYIIFNTEYFNKFTVTNEMQENTENMLESNDTIQLFINELKDQDILNNSHLPAKYMYEFYKNWLYENNPGSRPMRAMEFGTRFSRIIKEFGYTKVEKKRLNQITDEQFDRSLLNIELDESKLKNNKITIYINEDKLLNMDNVNQIIYLFNQDNDISPIKKYSINEIRKAYQFSLGNLRGLLIKEPYLKNKINENELDEFINIYNDFYVK